jgi:hypothetical protein
MIIQNIEVQLKTPINIKLYQNHEILISLHKTHKIHKSHINF